MAFIAKYRVSKLRLNQFDGGEANGPMLQLSIGQEHIQLTREQARGLKTLLDQWEFIDQP